MCQVFMGLLQRSNRSWLHLPKRWALRRGAPKLWRVEVNIRFCLGAWIFCFIENYIFMLWSPYKKGMTPLLGQENSLKLQFWHRFTAKAFQNHTLLIFKIDLPFLFPFDSPSRKVGQKQKLVGRRPACCAAPKFNFSASLARPMLRLGKQKRGGRNSFQKTSMFDDVNFWWMTLKIFGNWFDTFI